MNETFVTNVEKNVVSLYVLVDEQKRIVYTGEYTDLETKLTPELKLIKLEGVYK